MNQEQLREEFKKKFGEPETNNHRVAGSEDCDDICDWWLEKIKEEQERILEKVSNLVSRGYEPTTILKSIEIDFKE